MKILRVIASMNPSYGGPCQGLRNTIPEQKKEGITNEVVCMDDPHSSFLGKDDFPVVALGPSANSWMYTNKLIPWLDTHLGEYNFVIIHGLWLFYGYAVYKAIKALRKKEVVVPKLFVMPHGMLDPYFQAAEGRKLKAIRNWFYWKLIEEKIINNADGVLFTCAEELKLAQHTFAPYHPKKILNVSYGVLSPPIETQIMKDDLAKACPSLGDVPYLLFLSRIHKKKGVDLLVRAYLRLRSQNVKLPKLVIVGPGLNTTFGKEVYELASICKDIHFLGLLTGNSKWGAFYGCEALILPSHQENFGISVVEALACKKPVLITDKINIWNEIQYEDAGLITNDTFDDLVNMLMEWSKTTDKKKIAMGEKAYACYRKNFASEQASRKFIQAISNI